MRFLCLLNIMILLGCAPSIERRTWPQFEKDDDVRRLVREAGVVSLEGDQGVVGSFADLGDAGGDGSADSQALLEKDMLMPDEGGFPFLDAGADALSLDDVSVDGAPPDDGGGDALLQNDGGVLIDAHVAPPVNCDEESQSPPCNGCPSGTTVPPGYVCIPGGSFAMGSNSMSPNEQPEHDVLVAPFLLGRNEVTVSEYLDCVLAGVCTEPTPHDAVVEVQCNWGREGYEAHPVNCVDWSQAEVYAVWRDARLPRESEWEYAARSGGHVEVYPWGDEPATCDLAVINGAGGPGCSTSNTWPVCSRPEGNTAQGVCDMAGNVLDLVDDCAHSYGDHPEGVASPDCDDQAGRIARGGSWFSFSNEVNNRLRAWWGPEQRANYVGFRLARTLP